MPSLWGCGWLNYVSKLIWGQRDFYSVENMGWVALFYLKVRFRVGTFWGLSPHGRGTAAGEEGGKSALHPGF